MNERIIKNNKKTIGMIIGGVAFIVLAISVTYAWLTWISGETTLEGTTGSFSVAYSKGGNIFNESLLPVESYLDGESSWVVLKKDSNMSTYATINLSITNLVTRGNCYEASIQNENVLCQGVFDIARSKCLILSNNFVTDVTNTYCNSALTWNSDSNTCSNSLFTTQETCEMGITYFETDVDMSHLHYAIYPGVITYDGDAVSDVTKNIETELASGTLKNINNDIIQIYSNIELTDEYQAFMVYIWLDSDAGNEFVGTTITGNISASATTQVNRRTDLNMLE